MQHAMKQDEPVSVEIRSTLADGLAVPTVGYNAFVTVKPIVDRMVSKLNGRPTAVCKNDEKVTF